MWFLLISSNVSLVHWPTFNSTSKIGDIAKYNYSHKKQKDSLTGRLNRVLFAAEIEFPKILVPRPPKDTSNVSAEWAGKLFLCDIIRM